MTDIISYALGAMRQNLKNTHLTAQKPVFPVADMCIFISGSERVRMTIFILLFAVVAIHHKLAPIVLAPQEYAASVAIHTMNTFGSIRKEKTTLTTTVCTVRNVRQPLAKITFTEVTKNVLFAATLLPMSISGNGTEINRIIYGTIFWSVPAVQKRRNLINFMRGMAKQDLTAGIVSFAVSADLPWFLSIGVCPPELLQRF